MRGSNPFSGCRCTQGDPILHVTNQIEGGTITLLTRDNAGALQVDLGSRPASEYPEYRFLPPACMPIR